MSNGIRLANRSLTLYRRRDAQFRNKAEEQRAAESAKKFLADSFSWQHDLALMTQLRELLSLNEGDAANARWKVQRAIETGELVTMPDAPSSGLSGSRGGNDAPRPRSVTFTPSQLFKSAPRMASCVREYVPRRLPKLPADDFFAIMAAKPGDVLPDGSIAKAYTPKVLDDNELEALRQRVFGNADAGGGDSMFKSFGDTDGNNAGSLLGDGQPFEYQPGEIGDGEQTAWLPSTGGPPNSWLENDSGKKQWRYYDGNGNAAVDIDFGHDHGFGAPHSHNWDNGARDDGNPVSIF